MIMEKLACKDCDYYSILKVSNVDNHRCSCEKKVPWFIDGEPPKKPILAAYFNLEGDCPDHSEREKSAVPSCHWCGTKVILQDSPKRPLTLQDFCFDYREDKELSYIKCPTCQTTHDALKKSLDHWIDNCNEWIGNKYAEGGSCAQAQVWWAEHAGASKCACCQTFKNTTHGWCRGCPLNNDGCCGKAYSRASYHSEVGTLKLSHLQKIRDYIYLICVREGIVGKPKKGIMERLQHTLNEARKVYGEQDYTFVVGKNVHKELFDIALTLYGRAQKAGDLSIGSDGDMCIFFCDIEIHNDDPDEIRITWGTKQGAVDMEKGKTCSVENPSGVCLTICPNFVLSIKGLICNYTEREFAVFPNQQCIHNRGYHVTPVSDE